VQELKGSLLFLLPLLLLAAMAILQIYLKAAGRRRAGEAVAAPPAPQFPEPLESQRGSDQFPVEGSPGSRTEPEAPRGRRRSKKTPETSSAPWGGRPPGARIRIRRLLATSGGRRIAVLAHEIFRQPPGLG
jgi:hypothetical protein